MPGRQYSVQAPAPWGLKLPPGQGLHTFVVPEFAYFPGAHMSQEGEPVPDTFPSSQVLQDSDRVSENFPGGQKRHVPDREGAYVPEPHETHEAEPRLLNVPTSQDVQLDAASAEYVPEPQIKQSSPAAE